MGWFEEQIRQRLASDEARFSDSFARIAQAVRGGSAGSGAGMDAGDAVRQILGYYGVASLDFPEHLKSAPEKLDYAARLSGLMRRAVTLEGAWYRDAIGAMLGQTREGKIVALLPRRTAGYAYRDPDSGKTVRVNAKTAAGLSRDALCFYRPFPQKKLGLRDLLRFIARALHPMDIAMVAGVSALVTAVGLLMPRLNLLLFGPVAASGRQGLLLPVAALILSASMATLMMVSAKTLLLSQLEARLDLMVQSATMMRVLSLPANFFKGFSAGELSSRVRWVSGLCSLLVDAALSTGLSSLFSLAYVGQIFSFAPALALPAFAVALLTLLVSVATSLMQVRHARARMENAAKQSGTVFDFINGIQKIKLAGAEKRAFSKWAEQYAAGARMMYQPAPLIRFSAAIPEAIALVGTAAMYFGAVKSGVSPAEYMAFSVSFGMVTAAFSALSGIAVRVASVKPMMQMVEPILSSVPESTAGRANVERLTGGIELDHVSFRYSEQSPPVIRDLSLKILPGQYVAVVGKTGCGKSTLLRLLLAFEAPQAGSVSFDGMDVSRLEPRSLRRQIGVVTQNGKLFQGDIFSNIAISSPGLTLEEAWEAAEIAGIAEDIRRMPMGMHTLISEGAGGVSGGQRQRLMIARAIARKPRVLMLDEATSALDNLTQKQVTQSLDRLKCTRIVVAHRLSTIRQCGRIILLEDGAILEDGSYDELMARRGSFAQLVKRQQLEPEEQEGRPA